MAIVDRGTLHIEGYYDGVLETGDYAVYEGRVYSTKPPGSAFLGVPVYWGLNQALARGPLATVMETLQGNHALAGTLRQGGTGLEDGKVHAVMTLYLVTLVTVSVPSALLGVVLYRLAGHLVPASAPRVWAVLAYGLGSSAFPYSGAFYGHQMVAVMLFGAFALAHGMGTSTRPGLRALAVGALLGYAVITEHPAALIAAPVMVYLFLRLPDRRHIGLALLGGLLPGVLWMGYNMAVFGRPIAFAYEYEPLFHDVNTEGFFSLSYPRAEALWGITFGSYRGLFFLSPVLLFALAGLVPMARQRTWRAEFWLCLWAVGSFMLFNGSSVMWQGGHGVGPRYLVPMLPFMVLPLALAAAQWARMGWVRGALAVATVWSFTAVWAQTLGGQNYPDYTLNPLFRYSLPRLLAGDVARNLGMGLGLTGWLSLAPLLLALALLVGLLSLWAAESRDSVARPALAGADPGVPRA
jgi:hypothetical protein